MIQSSQCHSRGLLHAIFCDQEQKMKGRPYLEAKDYKSFYAKKLRIFSKCLKSEFSCQLQEDTTPCSSFQMQPFQAHCDPCNLSFPKSPHLHHKGS